MEDNNLAVPHVSNLTCPHCGSTDTLQVNPRVWACRGCKEGFKCHPPLVGEAVVPGQRPPESVGIGGRADVKADARPPLVELRYHVPKNQCYEGSRGRQGGNVHLHVMDGLFSPPLVRRPGEALCGRKRGWYEREPMADEKPCAECQARATRYGIGWPR